MITIDLTPRQVDLLFPALKQAESAYTNGQNWVATKELSKLYDSLHRQIYTFGQLDQTEDY